MNTTRPWAATLATVGLVAAGGIVAIGLTNLLDRSSVPTDTGTLEWSVVQFPATNLDAITAVDGRLVMTGADADGPAAWTSNDGLGWRRSTVVIRDQDNLRAEFLSMGIVSGHGDQLVALGHRMIASRDYWETALWTSSDGGESWVEGPEGSFLGTLDVVATDVGYVALGQGPDGIPAVWTSQTGVEWQRVADEFPFGDASVSAIAARDGQIVAVGARPDEAGPGPAMAWVSSDGVQWEPIILSGPVAGSAFDVVATDTGFVAVGSQLGELAGAVAWLSTDGREWRTVVLDRDGEILPTFAAASGGQFVAIGGRSLGRGTGRAAWFVLSPSQPPIPLDLDGGVRGLVGYRDRYVAVVDRGGPTMQTDCGPQLIVGLRRGTPRPDLSVE